MANLPIQVAVRKQEFDKRLADTQAWLERRMREDGALAASLQADPRAEKLRREAEKAAAAMREAQQPLSGLGENLRHTTRELAYVESTHTATLAAPAAMPVVRERAEAEVNAARTAQNAAAAMLAEARRRAEVAERKHAEAVAAMHVLTREHKGKVARELAKLAKVR